MPDLISEWAPALTNLSEEERQIIRSKQTVENKINSLRKETNQSEEQIIKEFREMEEEIEKELKELK